MAAKRQASPLESSTTKKKSDSDFYIQNCPAAWNSTEDTILEILPGNTKNSRTNSGRGNKKRKTAQANE